MGREDIPTVIHSNVYRFCVVQELPPVNITRNKSLCAMRDYFILAQNDSNIFLQ